MASFEDHRNAKTRALILKQHDYVKRHKTHSDHLKLVKSIKLSQISRQAQMEADHFRLAASRRPGPLRAKYIQRLEILEHFMANLPPKFDSTPPMMP